MQAKIVEMLNLKPEEVKLAFSLWLLIAVNTLVLELSDVVATAGFVSNLGVYRIPWLWVVTTLITIFAAGGYLVVVDRYPRVYLVLGLLLGLAVVYLVLEFLFAFKAPDWLTYPALYLLADQQFMIMPLAFWAMAGDVFATSESKRIFPFIASGTVIGGLIGNAAAGWMTFLAERYSFGLSQVFTAVAIILILNAAFVYVNFSGTALRTRQSREGDTGIRDAISVGLDYFLNVPMLKTLGVLMLFTGFILTLLEFNFLVMIDGSVSNNFEFQRFLGYYKALQTAGLLIFQWLITGRLLTRIPLKNAFAVLPAALFTASGLALAIPSLLGVASARFLARTVYNGWDDPARKAVQGLIPDERRGRISAFMDSYFITTSTVMGCIVLIVLLALVSSAVITLQMATWIYLGLAGVTSLVGVGASVYFRKVYEASLLNYRLTRSKRKSALDGIEF